MNSAFTLPSLSWQLKYTPDDGDLLRRFYIPVQECAVRYDRSTEPCPPPPEAWKGWSAIRAEATMDEPKRKWPKNEN
ncbi:hypothetical protein [Desulfonatronum parangueonense]